MKRVLLAAAVAALLLAPVPAWASGDVGVFGSYADTKDFGAAGGGGVKFGVPLGNPTRSPLALALRGTWFNDVTEDSGLPGVDLRAIPVEAGLKFNITHRESVNWFLEGGGSYYFLHSNIGDVNNEVGWYASTGVEAGKIGGANFFVEGIYRDVTATVRGNETVGDLRSSTDIQLRGVGADAGLVWRW